MTTETAEAVFLDANAIIYALDLTNDQYNHAVSVFMKLWDAKAPLCTSHHVIEEVVHIVQKIQDSNTTPAQVIEQIAKIPDLILIEPAANLDFAKRYAALSQKFNMGINDALLLQLMLDAGITCLFSYDQKFLKRASTCGIQSVIVSETA